MDSWFAFSSILARLHELLPVICRAKDMPNVRYRFQGRELRLNGLYSALKKRPGRPNTWRAPWWRAKVWR